MAWDTAANIINDALLELGLRSAELADPYASTDVNVVRLCRHLKSLGQDLVRDVPWSHLQKTHTLATVNGQAAYALPADFARFTNQTAWNRTQQQPLLGPVAAQGWQVLKAQDATGLVERLFRIVNNELTLHPTPTAAETLAFEYVGLYWVQPSGQAAPTSETPTAAGDTLWLERRLLVTGLKLRFLRSTGFDSTAAQEDYERALQRARGSDGAAPVLHLSRRGLPVGRLLDGLNLPDTGYGS